LFRDGNVQFSATHLDQSRSCSMRLSSPFNGNRSLRTARTARS
jgi:hypothetical protein